MAKKKPSLADHVEATERREAPRAQARRLGRSMWTTWLLLATVTVVILAGAVAFLRFKQLI